MSPIRAVSLATVVGLTVFCAVFAAHIIIPGARAPIPTYYPELREWRIEARPDEQQVSMGWYGRSLYAAVFGGTAFILAAAALRKWGGRLEKAEDLHLYAAMILGVVLFVTCLIHALNDLGVLKQQP